MNIDIFTFVAQIINLIVLLFLLRKFLYLPVLKAVTERQQAIAEELKQAEEAKRSALAKEKTWQRKIHDLDAKKQEIISNARIEAEKLLGKLQEDNRKAAQAQYEHWQQNFKAEQQNLEIVLQQLVVEHFSRFSQKVLEQMAGVSLSDTIIEKFKEKFAKLSATDKSEFVKAAQKSQKLTVQTAHELSKAQKDGFKTFLQQQLKLDSSCHLSFEERKELICGVLLEVGEQAVAWNLESYLQEFNRYLSDEVMQLLNRG